MDWPLRVFKGLCKKKSTCTKILIFAVGIPLFGGLLALLIIYRDHFDLGKNPIDYLEIILDCYAIFEIYTCVGFFMMQSVLDCKKKSEPLHKISYYRYTIKVMIEETKNYLDKMTITSNIITKKLESIDRNKNPSYYDYLQSYSVKTKAKLNFYELQKNAAEINNNLDNNTYMGIKRDTEDYDKDFNVINKDQNNQEITTKKIEGKDNQVKESEKEKEMDVPTRIRKYKQYVRRITKFKKLYHEIDEEIKGNLSKYNKCYSCFYYVLYINFFVVIATDIILPLALGMEIDFSSSDIQAKKDESTFELVVGTFLSVGFAVIFSSYTIITIYATTRKEYITGDYLYDKQINDTLSLLKTVQIICGYSFAILYCNLYLWKVLEKEQDVFGKPKFYDQVVIPDYIIKHGISVLMIVKVIIIIVTIICSLYCSDFFVFQNDLADYNLGKGKEIYNNEGEFSKFLLENKEIVNILKNEKY